EVAFHHFQELLYGHSIEVLRVLLRQISHLFYIKHKRPTGFVASGGGKSCRMDLVIVRLKAGSIIPAAKADRF
ncbi:MAG: hypothetical protein PUF07_07805, partial [Bacteroidales bacterium]|nr:hypothetical protein [Bacteroidales bacterium]